MPISRNDRTITLCISAALDRIRSRAMRMRTPTRLRSCATFYRAELAQVFHYAVRLSNIGIRPRVVLLPSLSSSRPASTLISIVPTSRGDSLVTLYVSAASGRTRLRVMQKQSPSSSRATSITRTLINIVPILRRGCLITPWIPAALGCTRPRALQMSSPSSSRATSIKLI